MSDLAMEHIERNVTCIATANDKMRQWNTWTWLNENMQTTAFGTDGDWERRER